MSKESKSRESKLYKSQCRKCESVLNSSFCHFESLFSFSQKGCTPHPLPPTIKLCPQKLPLFAFRGRAQLFPLLAKNRRLHFCNLKSDVLHHEAGEIKGANAHNFIVDCFGESCDSPRNDGVFRPQNNSSIDCFATLTNSANCGGSFVFLKIFRIEARLGVCEILKIFKSAKNAPKDELPHGVRYA